MKRLYNTLMILSILFLFGTIGALECDYTSTLQALLRLLLAVSSTYLFWQKANDSKGKDNKRVTIKRITKHPAVIRKVS